jgi:hypothetical protein
MLLWPKQFYVFCLETLRFPEAKKYFTQVPRQTKETQKSNCNFVFVGLLDVGKNKNKGFILCLVLK